MPDKWKQKRGAVDIPLGRGSDARGSRPEQWHVRRALLFELSIVPLPPTVKLRSSDAAGPQMNRRDCLRRFPVLFISGGLMAVTLKQIEGMPIRILILTARRGSRMRRLHLIRP